MKNWLTSIKYNIYTLGDVKKIIVDSHPWSGQNSTNSDILFYFLSF